VFGIWKLRSPIELDYSPSLTQALTPPAPESPRPSDGASDAGPIPPKHERAHRHRFPARQS
jgi:hypothetical protein